MNKDTNNLPARCRIRLFYFTLATLFFGYVSVESFIEPVLENIAFAKWERVPCMIEVSALKPWGSRQDFLFAPQVRFTYNYAGESYQGTQFSWSGSFKPASDKKVLAQLKPFVVGREAACIVDPEMPGRAYLKRPYATGWLPLWLGGMVFVSTFYVAVKLIDELRRKPLPM